MTPIASEPVREEAINRPALGIIDEIAAEREITAKTVQVAYSIYQSFPEEQGAFYWSIEQLAVTSLFAACKVNDALDNASLFVETEYIEFNEEELKTRTMEVIATLDLEA